MLSKKKVFFFILLIIVACSSCSAPRNNPLDPENPNNKIGTIEGYVKTIKIPQAPIANAEVYWENEGIITNTNELGYFKIESLKKKDGLLTIEKNNYSIDSSFVLFGSNRNVTKNIFLNAIPRIEDLNFYSITLNEFPNDQSYKLGVQVSITDEENDIDSVFIQNTDLNTNIELLYNASTKYYEKIITLNDLSLRTIDIVIGKNFAINVFDSDGKNFALQQSNIKRIIKEEIETTAPLGKDTVTTNNLLLEWRRFTPGFNFEYLLEIYTDEFDKVLMWQKEISSEEIQYLVDADLPPDDYFWVAWAIDEFENRTRSKQSSFVIK